MHEIYDPNGGQIVWDDEAGTVSGSSELVPRLHELLRHCKRGIEVMVMPFIHRLRNPRHDPADFLILLLHAGRGGLEDYTFPPALEWIDLGKVPRYRVEDAPR